MTTTHLLYLHGFRSSPRSAKAQQMAAFVQAQHPDVHWWCPQLPPSPAEAAKLIADGTAGWPSARTAVVGSSLGGFYATWFAQQTGCKAALVNPAVNPARDLERYIGEQTSWHDPAEAFYFRPEYIAELRALECPNLVHPGRLARFMVLVAKGDEVLDWREMAGRYAHAHLKVLEGGDHALSDFALYLDEISAFLGLARS